jgi:putative transposon-encoded protein
MKRVLAGVLLAVLTGSAYGQTEVMPFGSGAMIQPPNGPAMTLSPSPNGTVLQTPGGPPVSLPNAGNGTTLTPTGPAAAPTQIKPFGSSTVIETPGQPAVICTPVAGRITCN